MITSLIENVCEVEKQAANALVHCQSKDGFWRDFYLKPGQSEAWSTAWTGWSLAHAPNTPEIVNALRLSSSALIQCGSSSGWGYNRNSSTDADTTAWVLRFLSITSPLFNSSAWPSLLLQYVDSFGEAHTFNDFNTGSWSKVHSDVTALVGLALIDTHANLAIISSIRKAVLARTQCHWPPLTFWWSTNSYGLSWTIAFLERSGGLPRNLFEPTIQWLDKNSSETLTTFEHALDLISLSSLQQAHTSVAIWHVTQLIAMFQERGWKGSLLLLVPPQREGEKNIFPIGPHSDSGIMTTSLALASLVKWRLAINKWLSLA